MTTRTIPRISHGWHEVQDALAADIRAGSLGPGMRLPTEPALMARFGAGRHSIRRAVAALEASGLVRTRQGSGTYVREAPLLDYRLSERTRFSRNLLEQGREPSGAAVGAMEMAAPPSVAEALRLPLGEPVFWVRRLGLADGVPVNLSDAHYPARRFPGMLGAWETGEGASAVLAAYGVADYRRIASTVLARLPSPEEARLLDQPAAQPVLVVRKVDADLSGIPIACSETVWAGERVQLSVDHAAAHERREETPHVDR
ncbi:phosphonate metabolism transcriptional regulator PhnF [Roseomonas xinghualingensis]|uniref:phosphonate metabolism transcriptional regulator PhnF n=1 Tax=Roseomonas xinghualingensis TaxID=2986475 RepID=UPI0021F1B84C|nr:phosphonate metabolism transcriptional regulator PhnF [Roseomonas sp. SXEYE001]MCV4206292.1 phosphonate metabolism transcriptional regulator PhnF [Roseomonas sp. SXEYE001]